MTTTAHPMCLHCKHFKKQTWSCTAFPMGVPLPILHSQVDHRLPYDGDGDGGTTFESKDDQGDAWCNLIFGPFPPATDDRTTT